MREHIQQLIADAIAGLPGAAEVNVPVEIERTRDRQHGDYACNISMRLAKPLRDKPLNIAQAIADAIPASELVESIEIAGPGFINFHLSAAAYHRELMSIVERGAHYGTGKIGAGTKVIVEYVSANPTGPLHVGHGRHAAYGASVANLLIATGHDVHQEYYVNDAGRQMDILTLSVWLRMFAHAGIEAPFPSNGYHGQYVVDIAREAYDRFADSVTADLLADPGTLPADAVTLPADATAEQVRDNKRAADIYLDAWIQHARNVLGNETFRVILECALDSILGDIKEDMAEFGAIPDEWFSERSLMDSGAVQRALDRVAEHGKSYEKDGAIWFRATDYGDEKDRVIVRENGVSTYFASDIAYHLHKRERGFASLLDILGADHHGYIARVRGGLEAMGEPPESLDVELVQFVVLASDDPATKQMSTRSGKFITLRWLRNEVGNDAVRFFFVMRSNDQHLEFDLDLARSQSNDNPVYYVQYAHARVLSVMRELEARGMSWMAKNARDHLARLTEDHEQALMQRLTRYPEIVELAAMQRAPQFIVQYLRELAHEFHTYYNAHRFIVEDEGLRDARLLLINATRQVIRNGLALVGVSAPETM
ncbi:MAG: arginine--tRNA ligase [Gammaproteobacteria bacterium]|nr:arginine--tRNA ligase [Gammaproteobacteria bacterium]NND35529.1 arginine--tRNA ligase [Gammaproteobacteria bacterium]